MPSASALSAFVDESPLLHVYGDGLGCGGGAAPGAARRRNRYGVGRRVVITAAAAAASYDTHGDEQEQQTEHPLPGTPATGQSEEQDASESDTACCIPTIRRIGWDMQCSTGGRVNGEHVGNGGGSGDGNA